MWDRKDPSRRVWWFSLFGCVLYAFLSVVAPNHLPPHPQWEQHS